ncbi:MAG: single-stranded-DNA-specific exonuclease RecJ [Candidatus Hydrogenedentes bacterium]|nr:single-stranded-DNA-specific exonuclease RecJ [Candidatus Hydrogenedentota bacterium]
MKSKCDWRIAEAERAQVRDLAGQLDVHPILASILISRGYTTREEASRFLAPSVDALCDPLSLEGMAEAAGRIRRAKETSERVLVFGDYDVDGIAGTALLTRALRRYGIAQCDYGMPSRLKEGYGLGTDHVEEAKARGVSLIITVDNGISAHTAALKARELGLDLIVTDHHLIDGELPPAVAVINPKRQPASHPAADACGVAVAFHLARALTGEIADLDLVALGTIADIVPLRGENRDLVAAGLRVMRSNPRVGIRALMRVANLNAGELRAEDIAFQLAPRINAGGRMGDGQDGLHLLLTESRDEAEALAQELDAANEERRQLESETLEEALRDLEDAFLPQHRSIVLARRGWHRGVIGIVASRIQSTHYRPVILVALDENGVGRGSARSITGFNIAEALSACDPHLEAYGGHAAAAGLTVREDRLDSFRDAFETEAARILPSGELRRELHVDAQVGLSQIDSRLVAELEKLQPFGHANLAPLFCTFGAEPIPNSLRELRGGHLKTALRNGSKVMDAIGFRMGERLPELRDTPAIDIAFTPQFNTWRGETTVQLILKDIRPAG